MVDIGPRTRCNISPGCVWRQPNWCWPKCIAYLLKNSHRFYGSLACTQSKTVLIADDSKHTTQMNLMQKKSADVYVVILILVVDSFTMSFTRRWCGVFSVVLRFQINYQYWLAVVVQMFDKSYDVSKQLPIIVITIKSIEPHDFSHKNDLQPKSQYIFIRFKRRVDNLLARTEKNRNW